MEAAPPAPSMPAAAPVEEKAAAAPPRTWPVVVLLVLMALTRFAPQLLDDNGPPWVWIVAAMGPPIGALLIGLWWMLFSRTKSWDRALLFFGMIGAFALTLAVMHPTMLGPGVLVMTIPIGGVLFALAAILTRELPSFRRTMIVLACGAVGMATSTLVRSDGMWGNFLLGVDWRWTTTSEERIVAYAADREAKQVDAASVAESLGDIRWPGFRGPDRDSKQHGPAIATDWDQTPPELLWKAPAGPGWSSFAVAGKLLFTQEQRDQAETIVCYDADSGKEIWTRAFEGRFDDPLGGPGPRATPTLADGGLFVQGATGIVACLDAATGEVIWRRDLQEEADRKPPMWGFSGSPLVVDSLVIVYAGGDGDKGVLAFDATTGEPRWGAPAGELAYTSPQLATVAGKRVVMSLSNTGLDLLDPATGELVLRHDWPIDVHRSVQPQVLGDADIVIPSELGKGTRRIHVEEKEGTLVDEVVWTSRSLKPDFNDFVIYEDHAYGFDGRILVCVKLADGKQAWKGGRYGKGQVLLLADAGLLLVVSEQGELVLLEATPERRVELSKFQALDGKTWNHPVVDGDRLYVRNSQEAAAYRLPLAESGEEIVVR
ncbi:PQQ-binding-like beta-propeller repeat protein [Botrimarina mediterranea]|uniref:Outer membrane biogenesis protein BamB n=2 Tax=Botrimarina mediterranea TaxID=2528022 RepID=A0A518K9G5_9BACT|nr:outer membrane biogenesis protein BamB [Botrimarina mediterranea]QDV79009.1 outer membrane biogenesis protein BamB [Planctomycetes bacterium K2D]